MLRYSVESDNSSPKLIEIDLLVDLSQEANLLDDIRSPQIIDPRLAHAIHRLQTQLAVPFSDKHTLYVLINRLLYEIRHFNA
jgi:hypothetical protein